MGLLGVLLWGEEKGSCVLGEGGGVVWRDCYIIEEFWLCWWWMGEVVDDWWGLNYCWGTWSIWLYVGIVDLIWNCWVALAYTICCCYGVISGGLWSWGKLKVFWLYCRWDCGRMIGDDWIMLGWVWVGLEMDWSLVKVFFRRDWFELFWFVDMTKDWTKSLTVWRITVWNALKRWLMVLISAVLFRWSCSVISLLWEVSISLRSLLLVSFICFRNSSWLKDDWIV